MSQFLEGHTVEERFIENLRERPGSPGRIEPTVPEKLAPEQLAL
jgi:hypothetical protein